MTQPSIPDLIARLVAMNGGSAQQAAVRLGTTAASLSRWKTGKARPRPQLLERLRTLVDGSGDLIDMAEKPKSDGRLERLEEAVSGTIHALREEFHRTASVSSRQEVLDLVAALFFAHVTSIDAGARGIGEHLRTAGKTDAATLNAFMSDALSNYLPQRNGEGDQGGRLALERFFSPFSETDEWFAGQLLRLFERDAHAFRVLHEVGRDDLINEVFSRFMSTSFVDEKEMGQYLTPPEITRFMVEAGFHALTPEARSRLLNPDLSDDVGVILDPSCGVGSFLAETTRFAHGLMRDRFETAAVNKWLQRFVEQHVVGIDKSDRMLRLAMINLGLFGAKAANLKLANALAKRGAESEFSKSLEGKVELILTNPPFGASFSGDDLKGFAMGNDRARADSEVLFLERYIDWLAPGGIVASVVPDSILVNRNAFADLRSWLYDRCSVDAVFSLPPVTFGATGTQTKTSVLILRKDRRSVVNGVTYFGEAREVGFDVVTRSGQRRRIRTERSDLPTLLTEYKDRNKTKMGRCKPLDEAADRWDATFHIGLPDNISALVDHPATEFIKVSDVAVLVDDRTDPRRQGWTDFEYVEISDVDTRIGVVGSKRVAAAEAPSRARKLIREGDVLVSTVRPERGSIGVTPARLDRAICSTGFAVLRCKGIHPLALVWLLKTNLVRHQVIRNNIGIAYPAISESACLDLVLPIARNDLPAFSASAEKLWKAQEQFEAAQRAFLDEVNGLDCAATGAAPELRQVPNLVEGCEPSAITNVA
ncbi:N-6 DNA methylase [Azospirillum formosense]|uniref:N-6 DNA methylase n=1 Tax=Azospirillum formosense TaxID=861533 RepID=UPI00338ED13A